MPETDSLISLSKSEYLLFNWVLLNKVSILGVWIVDKQTKKHITLGYRGDSVPLWQHSQYNLINKM